MRWVQRSDVSVIREVRRQELRALTPGSNRLFNCCVDLGFEAEDTVGNAQEIAAWADAKGYDSLIVVTSDYHMPRALTEIRAAAPGVELTAYAVETLTPYLEASGTGSIVMLSSTAALETFIAPNPFNAIKAALITYASQLSQAYAAKGIRVNTVSPGAVYYKGGNWEIIEEHMKPLYDATLAKMPTGRFGEPVEVAKAIVFVASPAVPYMTGANIVVDGGFTQRVQF